MKEVKKKERKTIFNYIYIYIHCIYLIQNEFTIIIEKKRKNIR
jgi:hypothetical protein